jgi:hypothetical protein
MFSWFVSLLLLFSSHGKVATTPSVGLDGSGNGHVAPADSSQPNPTEPADTDGKGQPPPCSGTC